MMLIWGRGGLIGSKDKSKMDKIGGGWLANKMQIMAIPDTILASTSKSHPIIWYGVAELKNWPSIKLYVCPCNDNRVPHKENYWCGGLVRNMCHFTACGEKRLSLRDNKRDGINIRFRLGKNTNQRGLLVEYFVSDDDRPIRYTLRHIFSDIKKIYGVFYYWTWCNGSTLEEVGKCTLDTEKP